MSDPTTSEQSPSIRRMLAVGIAVLIPVIPIVVALVAFHSSSKVVTVTQTTPSAAAPGQTGTSTAPATPVSRIPSGHGAIIAYVTHRTALYVKPRGRRFAALTAHTSFDSPTWVLVSKVQGDWLGVINNAAGNNRIGWIHESAAQVIKRIEWRIQVHLDRHLLVVYHDGSSAARFSITTGKPSAPTPTGHYAITDRLTTGDPAGPYGCCILGTSAKAPHHISDWDGGNRIAIHSTPPDTYWGLGESISHGCMHVSLPEGRWLLAHIPLGTPLDISSA